MAEFLFALHSGVRYVVLMTALVAVAAAIVAFAKRKLTPPAIVAYRLFVAAVDIQVLIGLVLVFIRPFFGALIGHIVLMIAVLGWLHGVAVVIKRRGDDPRLASIVLATVAGTVVLIVAGIMSIQRPVF